MKGSIEDFETPSGRKRLGSAATFLAEGIALAITRSVHDCADLPNLPLMSSFMVGSTLSGLFANTRTANPSRVNTKRYKTGGESMQIVWKFSANGRAKSWWQTLP